MGFGAPQRISGADNTKVRGRHAAAAGSGPARPLADECPSGEPMDVYSMACTPDVVPNTGAPSENALTQCGGDQGQCVANEFYGPGNVHVPHLNTRVQQSP
jgi:hypothetical protein